ncbi:hypothetical protein [Flavobacterium sp.]|jgi:hypothetical protein|uniref:hypothetical protein n=1 Tax=Flavobacterium sp. TaxID=239 RepID=UPI002631E277|nr:hypothetical protein [Flavobacterium sp.]
MKKGIFILVLFVGVTSWGQFGLGNNGAFGNGTNRMGGYGPTQMGMPSQPRERSAEELEDERIKTVEKSVEKLKSDLKLDELQLVIVRKEMDANSKKINAILKKEMSNDDKNTEIQAITETMERNILNFLNDEQKKKFKAMIEERYKQMEMMKQR